MKRRILYVVLILGLVPAYIAIRLMMYPYLIREFAEEYGKDVPINFYARIVDSSGDPISGAEMTLSLQYYSRSAPLFGNFGDTNIQEKSLTLVSGASGEISVEGLRGRLLRIKNVRYDDLKCLSEALGDDDRNTRFFAFHNNGTGYFPDPTSPAVFPLIKEGQQPLVWPCRGGIDRLPDPPFQRVNKPFIPRNPTVRLPEAPGTAPRSN